MSEHVLADQSGSHRKYDFGVIGHLTLDYISRGGKHYAPQMGSPCVYASLGARALNASVIIGSKVGRDYGKDRLLWLGSRGVVIDQVRECNSRTTAFKIKYVDGNRFMWAVSKCASLTRRDLSDLPACSALHMGPILNEIPLSLAISLTKRNAITSLDPQGYLRHILRDGRVQRSKWSNRALLKHLDVLKVSEDEASGVIGTGTSLRLRSLGPEIVLITKGRAGTTVWSKDHGVYAVPAYKTRVRDPTGAGDALVGAFLVTWSKTGDLAWSAAIGSAVASFVVEKVGPAYFGTRKEVEKRAKTIFNGITKLHGRVNTTSC
jgi:sugar/nucleoside kinase (ribokinase family)